VEVCKVRERKDGIKQVTIPKNSDICKGDWVIVNKFYKEDGRGKKDKNQ